MSERDDQYQRMLDALIAAHLNLEPDLVALTSEGMFDCRAEVHDRKVQLVGIPYEAGDVSVVLDDSGETLVVWEEGEE